MKNKWLLNNCLANGRLELECRLMDVQGRARWMLTRCVSRLSPSGLFVTGIMVDINERKEANQKVAFLAAYDSLTRLERTP